MISIKYSQLRKFGACSKGKYRFAHGRWFNTVILNRPVSLREIIEGKNNDNDIFWLGRRLIKAISHVQLYSIAKEMYEILEKHGLANGDTETELLASGVTVNKYQFDVRWFVKSVKMVIDEHGLAGSRGLESLITHVIHYRSNNLGPGYETVATELYNCLIDAPVDINWDYNNYRCRPCGE